MSVKARRERRRPRVEAGHLVLEKGPSPVNVAVLLREYSNREAVSYLLQGFLNGFFIPYQGVCSFVMSRNLSSVQGMEHIVRAKLEKELSEGRILGPFAEHPVPDLRVSPLGIVPKKLPGEFRLIHHHSYPQGQSMNDGIPEELCSVRYTSFDQPVWVVRAKGRGTELAKCDIKLAFRLLPVHPRDFELLGFYFEGSFYMDRALHMGCSVSCAAFEAFSSFLEWALQRRIGLDGVVHYLDGFLFVERGSGCCKALMDDFQDVVEELGVPLAHEKTEGPCKVLTFLGYNWIRYGKPRGCLAPSCWSYREK